jgi:non-ribosomal peptide synthetase component F
MKENKKFNKKSIVDIIALTPMQQGMFFHYLEFPESSRYSEQLGLSLTGVIDPTAIEEAWNGVIETNEMLRTVYRWEKLKNPVQMILKKHRLVLRYYNLTGGDAKKKQKLLAEIKADDRAERFDLGHVPFRVTLCQTGKNKADMIICNHHILYDGWSNSILLKEFFSTYNDLLEHRKPQKITKTKFRDFVKWIRMQDQDQDHKDKEEKFWSNYLLTDADAPKREKLPGKRRKKRDIRHTGQYRFKLPGELNNLLSSFAKQNKMTLSSLLTSAWGLLLQKYNALEDIIFDTTVSGRSAKIKGIEDMVGMFINTLPLRVHVHPDEKVSGLLNRLYTASQQREEYENTSLAIINEYLEAYPRETLFDSILILENYPLDNQLMQEKGKLSVDSFSISGMTHHDLTLIITIFEDIEFNVTFNKDLFDEETVEQLFGHFTTIIEEMVGNPHKEVSEIEVLSEEERAALWERFRVQSEPGLVKEAEYIAPRDAVEEKLAEVWAEVLNIRINRDEQDAALAGHPATAIGIDDNFFDFGGHSLKAGLLMSRIHRTFDVKVPMEEIFKQPTIRQLAQYIKGASEERYEAIEPAKEKDYYELSSVQHRMYSLQQLDPAGTAYNVSSIMEVEGEIGNAAIEKFQKTFRQLIKRHEVFRTSFQQVDGKPVQKIHEDVDFEIEYDDAGRRALGCAGVIENFIRPFDLSQAPLMRVRLVKIGTARHLLMLDLHHIVTDGFSMDKFVREFTVLYRGKALPALKKQYKDFSEWQLARLQSGKLKVQEDYWLKEFSEELPVLDILTDYPRPLVQQFEGERVHFVLDKAIRRRLNRLIRETGTTFFMVVLAAFNVLLYRYTGQEDIVIGTTIAGRGHPDLEGIMGLFIETLAIRNYPPGDKSFKAFLKEVRARTLAAYENEAYPFRELIKKTVNTGDMSHNPLFNVMLIVQNVDMAKLEVEGLTFIPYPYYSKVSKLDMTLEAVEIGGEIKFHIEYCTALFKPETIERLAGHFVNILREAAANPELPISQIDILSQEERRRILEEFKGSHWEPEFQRYPKKKRIETLFEEQVEKTPDNIAVVYQEQQLTYRQLNEKANLISKRIEEL